MTKALHNRRVLMNARLPLSVIDALERAAAENGTTFTSEIEARLVETLIADKLLTHKTVAEVCGTYAAVSVAVS